MACTLQPSHALTNKNRNALSCCVLHFNLSLPLLVPPISGPSRMKSDLTDILISNRHLGSKIGAGFLAPGDCPEKISELLVVCKLE